MVSVFGINQIVIAKDGSVCHPSSDRTIIVYGKTGLTNLEEDWVLPDLALFSRIIKSISGDVVDIVRDKNSFQMENDKVQLRYRLGNKEIIQIAAPEVVKDLVDSMTLGLTVPVAVVKKLADIQNTIKATYLHLVSGGGKLRFVVGEVDESSGSLEVDVDLGVEFSFKITADRLLEIVERIDSPEVTIKFSIEGKKLFQIAMPDFGWIIGGVKEVGE